MTSRSDGVNAKAVKARDSSRAAASRAAKTTTLTEGVGQIGLGIMGGAFAKHLTGAGFNVVGYDVDKRRCSELVRMGATIESSVASVARRCRVIITSLPSVAALEDAFFAQQGL